MKLKYLPLFFICACMNDQSQNKTPATKPDSLNAAKNKETEVDLSILALPADYKKLDLSKIGLKASAMVPKDAEIQQSALDDNEGKHSEYIIYAFHIPTGDSSLDKYGGIPAEIDIFTTQWPLKKHIDYIKNSSISFWKRNLKEDSSYCIYSTSPANTSNQPLRAKDKEVYQFIMTKKSKKDTKQYCIRSSWSFDLTREEMLKLFAIAKSIEI